jgi:hypothetical protein
MNRSDFLVTVCVVIVIGALSAPKVLSLANPIRDLKNTAVVCGATGDPEVIAPTGSPASMCVQNSSATCVRIGGDGVTTSTGLSIGDGCPAGKVFCADMNRAWCESESGDVTVQVIYGSN